MTIHIQAHGFALTDPLEEFTLNRIRQGLGARLNNIVNVRVGLSDINGPKGGEDKRCKVHISLPQQRDVVVEDTQTDMYQAIGNAMHRAKRTLNRRRAKLRARTKTNRAERNSIEPVAADTDAQE